MLKEELNKSEKRGWNDFVQENSLSIFHTTDFMEFLEEVYNYDPLFLCSKGEGEIKAIMPVMKVSRFFSQRFISMPFAEYGGPFGERKHVKSLIDEIRRKNFDFLELKDFGPKEEFLDKYDLQKVHKANVFLMDTENRDFEEVWNEVFHKNVRTEVRNARKNNLEIVEEKDWESYYRLYIKTLERFGSPPHSKKYYKKMDDYLGGRVDVKFAVKDGEKIAALLSLDYNGRSLIIGNVSDPNYWDYSPNDLLYSDKIEEIVTNNDFRWVDLGRTEPGASYAKFKERHGGEIKKELYSYVLPQSQGETANPYRYKNLMKWVQKFPYPITRTPLGPFIKSKFP